MTQFNGMHRCTKSVRGLAFIESSSANPHEEGGHEFPHEDLHFVL